MENRAKLLERALAKARSDPEILAVLLFGSAARQEETPASDLDVDELDGYLKELGQVALVYEAVKNRVGDFEDFKKEILQALQRKK